MLKPTISTWKKKKNNEKEESSYIMYLDTNNLYGWAMSQKLPSGNFRWIPCSEYINLDSYDENSAKGLILEVDLEYPLELHQLHKMLSNYCKKNLQGEKTKIGSVEKLIPNLCNKEKYVLHYRNLQLYLKLGMKKNSSSSRIFTK